MKRTNHQLTAGSALVALGLCLAAATGVHAQISEDVDLTFSLEMPDPVTVNTPITVMVGYGNLGPNTANSVFVNPSFINPGGEALLQQVITQEGAEYEALQATAEGTDTNGNVAYLFHDDFYCEHLWFNLQGDNGDPLDAVPIDPLATGDTGSFSFTTAIAMESPSNNGAVTITEPAELAQSWTLTQAFTPFVLDAAGFDTYGTTTCSKLVGTEEEDICDYIDDNCWGDRISMLTEPIEGELELVNDGSAAPIEACNELVDFTPGNIAVLQRGNCEFGVKGFNAEQAGASAVLMVNTTLCPDDSTSDQCVLAMGAGVLGDLVSIPMIIVANVDGEPIISALEAGTPVRAVFGGNSKFNVNGYSFLSEDTEVDPDETNNWVAITSDVSTASNPPVASFTYSPAAPMAGEDVMFTDTSTGDPTAWAWDFGDGAGTSTDQNPAYAYASAGSYTVTLTASNAGGSSDAEMVVEVGGSGQMGEMYYISAAALASGAEGSFFQTDVDVNNAGAGAASFLFQWQPRGEDNSSPMESESYTLGAGESVRIVNILADAFGLEPNAVGALKIVADSASLKIMSRTYNVSTEKVAGTFGQALPGIHMNNLIGTGESMRITFMSENDDLRANLGCQNGTASSVSIAVDLYDDEGAFLETETMDLAAYSNGQFNKVLEPYSGNGYADVSSATADAAFFCYGSVLDNGSNDPTTVLPAAPSMGLITYIPAAALASGSAGSFFQTDADVNNVGPGMATFQFMWFPRGEDNSAPQQSDMITLEEGKSARYENIVSSVFELTPNAVGAIGVSSDTANLIVNSRTYNVPSKVTGTFGQALPGVQEDRLIMTGETMRIIFMSENDDFRANFGCINGTGVNTAITIDLYDDTGAALGQETMNLQPWSNNQINKIFEDYAPVNGYADFSTATDGAAIYCYGSVVDNGSNDPTTILPQ